MDATLMHSTPAPTTGAARWLRGWHPAVAGSLAGLFAGLVYLLVQIVVSAWVPETDTFAPMYRKAAMLMGGEAANGTTTSGAFGIALLIHFTLAAAFGRLIGRLVRGHAPLSAAALGAVLGLGLYALNFHLIAPSAFPWFEEARGVFTAIAHALFGALAGGAAGPLQRGHQEAPAP